MSFGYYQMVSPYDAGWVAQGKSSCIERKTILQTEQGPMRADAILRAVNNGEWISFRHRDRNGARCSNPVTGAVTTTAPGRKIVFSDGRHVTLTVGHILPVKAPWMNGIVEQHEIIRAGDVEVGDVLLDGRVAAVEEFDEIEAVRLWTDIPRYIQTAEGLSVGVRQHEVCIGWFWDPEDISQPYTEVVGLLRLHHATPGAPLSLAGETANMAPEGDEPELITTYRFSLGQNFLDLIAYRGGCIGEDLAQDLPPIDFTRRQHQVAPFPPTTLRDIPAMRELSKKLQLRLLTPTERRALQYTGPEVGLWKTA